MFASSFLQGGNDPAALAEWFVASIALVIAVTLVYMFVLNRSPPPEGLTEAKVEIMQRNQIASDPGTFLSEAQSALKTGDAGKTVELSVRSASIVLSSVIERLGINPTNMNISDMAYLIQTKATTAPDITQTLYQLNLLRLRVSQAQSITLQEAEWAVNVAAWLMQLVSSQQISF